MSEVFEKRMKELKNHKKLSPFEYEQLLCLHVIAGRLVSIDDSLKNINLLIGKIEAKK